MNDSRTRFNRRTRPCGLYMIAALLGYGGEEETVHFQGGIIEAAFTPW